MESQEYFISLERILKQWIITNNKTTMDILTRYLYSQYGRDEVFIQQSTYRLIIDFK